MDQGRIIEFYYLNALSQFGLINCYMVRILFVCLGNICRSPLAEAIFNQLLREEGLKQEISCDSAGTGDWHIGERPDPRTQDVARRYQVPLDHRGRQFAPTDFATYDYIIAMDQKNRADVQAQFPPAESTPYHLFLMREFDDVPGEPDVPDPYWGGEPGFDDMYHLLRRCCVNLLAHVRQENDFR